jgi:hypothetical protein
VYLGDGWPEKYRGSIFMSNLHGHRINNDLPRRKGSGFTASHGADFLVSGDKMFLGLLLQTGPDGSVFITDWYDRGECHTRDNPDRGSGRVYRISYGKPARVRPDLARRSNDELVKLQLHRNEWFVTHARRLLQERAAAGPLPGVHDALRAILRDSSDATRRLRAVWALHVTGGLDAAARRALLDHPDEDLRAWAVQLELEDRDVDPAVAEKFARLAESDPSPVVRLYLAAGIRRLPPARRVAVLEGLVRHAEDAEDGNLPLVTWYAAEELAETNLDAAMALIKHSRIPLLREFMARRIAGLGTDRPVVNVASIGARGDGTTDDAAAFQAAIDRLAATGGRVLIPWGVHPYRILKPLKVSSDHLEFWGPGARLQFAEGAGLLVQGRPVKSLALRGLRVEGAGSGPVLDLRGVEDALLEDLQVKGGASIAAAGRLSIATSRFDTLEIAMPESGAPPASLRSVAVSRAYSLTGDSRGVRLDGCTLPAK